MGGGAANPKHVVVLMFENRSFDHVFGAFPGANGLLSAEGTVDPDNFNLLQPTQPAGPLNPKQYPVAITPATPLLYCADHNFASGMLQQLFGPGTYGWARDSGPLKVTGASPTLPALNGGFYSNIATNYLQAPAEPIPAPTIGPSGFCYYEQGSLAVLHKLAADFVLCDNWFCDFPGDTLLNRMFMHAAQTQGKITDQQQGVTIDCDTIFDRIEKYVGPDGWKMYAPWAEKDGNTVPNGHLDANWLNDHVHSSANAQHSMTDFAADAQNGTLPFYSFLMCWLPDGCFSAATDTSMHPASDIRPGENLLASVYNALRASPAWEETLLIVTFDENSGIYDHVPPPQTVSPAGETGSDWDPFLGCEVTFDFTLLGPRIPALLVSPWLKPGIAKGQLQNTSILRFLTELMPGDGQLTDRDGQAPSLQAALAEFALDQARTDCPTSYTTYADMPYSDGDLSKVYVVPDDADTTPPPYMAELAKAYRPRGRAHGPTTGGPSPANR